MQDNGSFLTVKGQTPALGFYVQEYSSSLIGNISPLLILYLFFFLVYIVLRQVQIYSILQLYLKLYLKWNILFGLFILTFQEEVQILLLQLFNLNFQTPFNIISAVACLLVIIHASILLKVFVHSSLSAQLRAVRQSDQSDNKYLMFHCLFAQSVHSNFNCLYHGVYFVIPFLLLVPLIMNQPFVAIGAGFCVSASLPIYDYLQIRKSVKQGRQIKSLYQILFIFSDLLTLLFPLIGLLLHQGRTLKQTDLSRDNLES